MFGNKVSKAGKGKFWFGYENDGISIKVGVDIDKVSDGIKRLQISREEKRLQERLEIERRTPWEIV